MFLQLEYTASEYESNEQFGKLKQYDGISKTPPNNTNRYRQNDTFINNLKQLPILLSR